MFLFILFFFDLQKACGSLKNLLKIRGGVDGDEPQQTDSEDALNLVTTDAEPTTDYDGKQSLDAATSSIEPLKKASTDMKQKMSSQVDKLDSLLTKAENAQYSMAHQNKQIKSFLAK